MAERRNGGAQPPPTGSAPSGQNRPANYPGTFQQNELGKLLPEPFPPPFPPLDAPSLDRLRREYVAGGGWAWYGQVARTLPNAIDDVTADFGDDLYDRMLFDPQISAVNTVWKASILESGMNMTSAIRSRSDVDYDLAAEIADEAAHMIQEFDGTLDDVLWNMLDCVAFGNKVAEQTYRLQGARKDGRKILVLDKFKVRPRRSTVFAVDIYLNLVGLLIRVPPNASPWSATMMFGPDDEPFNLLPPHKFVILQNKPKDNDPRGTSILRPAYSAWWRKQQIVPEYLRYLSQFAGPSLIGYVGPDAAPQPDPTNPGAVITAEQIMLGALQALRNGTAAAFPNGAKVDPLIMQGDGAAFLRAIDHCDQQITKAVLTQELATEEGKHMARAAAEVHQDVLDTLIRQGKLAFGTQIRNQLLKRWVSYNWGENAAHLAPLVGLGKIVLRDSPALWGAAAQLMGQGYLAPSQMQQLDEQIGLPVRDELELYPVEQDPSTLAAQQPDELTTQKSAAPAPTAAPAPASKPGQPAPQIIKPPPPREDTPWQKKVPPPKTAKHPPTQTKPGIPGMIGVRAHSRQIPKNSRGDVPGVTGTTPQAGGKKTGGKKRSQLYSVNEASSASTGGAGGLASPSAGAFASWRAPRPERVTYQPPPPQEVNINVSVEEPKPMHVTFDPIRVESTAKMTSEPMQVHIDQPRVAPVQPVSVTIRRQVLRDAEGRITGVVEQRDQQPPQGDTP